MKHLYILLLFGYLGGLWKGQAQTFRMIGLDIPKEKNATWLIGLMKGTSPFQSFDTPNNTYRELAKQTTYPATAIKDAKDKVLQDYEDAVLDDAIDNQKGR